MKTNNKLLISFFAGEPTFNDEKGGHPDAQPEAVVQVEEEEGQRWLYAAGRTFGPPGRRSGRHHEAFGPVQVRRRILHVNG